MDERRELVGRLLAHSLGGAVGGDELGVLGFELPKLALQPVVGLVGDLRPVEDVIEALVLPDLAPELDDAPRECARGGAVVDRYPPDLSNGLSPG